MGYNLKSYLKAGGCYNKWYWFLLILIILSIGFIINFVLKKRRKLSLLSSSGTSPLVYNKTILETSENIAPSSDNLLYEKETVRSSIFLFGHFEVIDKEGNDISRLFSPLLKEMFLLIIFYTLKDNKGVSSEKLYETLWEDKPIKDARNNFSVNIVKLKSLLEKVGETKIYKEHGKWRFEILNESIKLDYHHFLNISKDKLNSLDKTYINELLSIINKGAFLKEIQYSWIDDFKETVSDYIITSSLLYSSKADIKTEPEYILKLSNCIFQFDQMNEEALSLKCRCLIMLGKSALAKETYSNFCKEFKKNYGEDFTRTYSQIIGN